MKLKFFVLLVLVSLLNIIVYGQTHDPQQYYIVSPGEGFGLRFNNDDEYKIAMGNSSQYHLSPTVQSYSIKTTMWDNSSHLRGWTWGAKGQTPVAALNTSGTLQLNNNLYVRNKLLIGTTNPTYGDLWISSDYGCATANEFNNHSLFITKGDRYMFMGVDDNLNAGYIQSILRSTSKTDLLLNPQGGGVGIGTSSTGGYRLKVAGRSYFSDKISVGTGMSPTAHISIYDNSGAATMNFQSLSDGKYWIVSQNNQLQIGGIGSNLVDADGVINISNSGSVGIGGDPYWGTRMRIYGNLGVKGKIEAEDIEVKILSWSDFVFDEDYDLKSLDEVENFIEEKKHLPNVPSETEVLECGVNLGDMDATLLRKVEELTLYLIEQNKVIQEQNSRIDKLENDNIELKKMIK